MHGLIPDGNRRILRLLRLNIQLLFVDDGPRRPWKRNKCGGGLLTDEQVKLTINLTRQLLRRLKVPYHQAPAEAEAECSRLQALGIVDAVWSDDSDALMFGCGTLIQQHRVGKRKVEGHIRVYQARALLEKHDLDSDGFVLFAMLAGGDYNTKGLPDCGPKNAALLSNRSVGLAQKLQEASEGALPRWRVELQEMLRRYRKAIEVPFGFPESKPLNNYRNPIVSTTEQLRDLRGLRNGWSPPIKQAELRSLLRERFNFTTREFLKHIAPVFVARRLARVQPDRRGENVELGIQLKRTRKKKQDGGDSNVAIEAKITFSPLPVVDIDLSVRPPDEDWTKFVAKDGTPYDPTQVIECELLHCFLKHGLPDGALEYSKTQKRKRGEGNSASAGSTPSKKRRITPAVPAFYPQDYNGDVDQVTGASNKADPPKKKRGRPKKHQSSPGKPEASSDPTFTDQGRGLRDNPMPAVFRHPQALLDMRASILGSYNGEEDQGMGDPPTHVEKDRMEYMPQPQQPYRPKEPGPTLSTPQLIPGDTISPKTLRALRAAVFLSSTSSPRPPNHSLGSNGLSSSSSKAFVEHEVIDLT